MDTFTSGIWYLSESNIIWVANRNQPVFDAFGTVTISKDGNLVILDRQNMTVWSSNVSNIATNSIARLLNTGNQILSDNSTGETVWESFQDPSNLLVPKMKLSINERAGEKVKLTSWKSLSDPSIGNYSAPLERPDAPDVFLWFNGTRPYARTGPWNGRIFIGSPTMSPGYLYGWSVGKEDDGTIYVTFNFANDTTFAVLGLNPQGQLWTAWWNNKREVLMEVINVTYCDLYGVCWAFGSCNSQSSPICSCLNGYEPKNLEEWNRQNWTSACVRKKPFQCEGFANRSEVEEKDGFVWIQDKIAAQMESSKGREAGVDQSFEIFKGVRKLREKEEEEETKKWGEKYEFEGATENKEDGKGSEHDTRKERSSSGISRGGGDALQVF
ncbi:G-type lectin S-receptor-like serine/threonine-protein kinase At1g11330 [Prosopis cineraria]|uniref:G-type lectin S-receptor-like serine/threonine-protein kinase At1g11330 n=1 Tax=Prosopis cineraria TaxID=364024 RepID=UPI002410B3CF|nr:G-type lectin S-receptor-like serine/threonine-protein kinase At1g11330 [Prosopis cineraria]